jgi:hypothetical protein
MFASPIELKMLATEQVNKELVKNPYHHFVGSKSNINWHILQRLAIEQIKTTDKEK